MSSRHVQKLPPPRCVRPRSARWNACEWALARPGRVTPRRRTSRSRFDAGSDGGDAVTLDLDQDVGDDSLAAEPGEIGVIAGHSAIGTRTPRSAATSEARS